MEIYSNPNMVIQFFNMKVKEILEELTSEDKGSGLDMNFSTQRYAGQWNLQKESELIRSIIMGDPIPPLFFRKLDDSFFNYQLIDGKQRITTIAKFIMGAGKPMKLHKDTQPVPLYSVKQNADGTTEKIITVLEIAGKSFAVLPKEVQKRILGYIFDIKLIISGEQEDIDRIMFNLNNGVSPSGSDKAKMTAGQSVMDKVVKIKDTNPLFVCDMVFNPNQVKKNAYEECILYSLIQYTGKDIDGTNYTALQPKQLEKIIKQNADCWNDNMFKGLNEVFTELHNALPGNSELTEPYLNKKHLPVLVMNVDTFLAKYADEEITKEQYRAFMEKWFTEGVKSQEFYDLVVEDNKNISKRYNIEARIALMDNALDNYLATGDLGLTEMQEVAEASEETTETPDIVDSNDSYEASIKKIYSIAENMQKELNIDELTAYDAIYRAYFTSMGFVSLDDFDQTIRTMTEEELYRMAYYGQSVTSVIKGANIPQGDVIAYYAVYQYSNEHGFEDFKTTFSDWFEFIKDKEIPKVEEEIEDIYDLINYLTDSFKQFVKFKSKEAAAG